MIIIVINIKKNTSRLFDNNLAFQGMFFTTQIEPPVNDVPTPKKQRRYTFVADNIS